MIRIGIIGAGHWGPNLIRAFCNDRRGKVIRTCDADRNRIHQLKERYPDIEFTADASSILEAQDIDAVAISTPTSTHAELCRAALTAGKHVFVEKPLATNVEDAQSIVRMAEERELKLMVGHTFLFNSGIQYLKKLIDDGILGDIHYIYSVRTNLGPIRTDVNALWDLAPHDIAVLLYLLGDMPASVSARGASFINQPMEDVCFANLSYASGVFANIHVSWLDPRKVRQMTFVGSRKMAIFDDMDLKCPLKIFDKGVWASAAQSPIADDIRLFRESIFEGRCTTPEIPPAEPLKSECAAFLAYLLEDMPQPSAGKFSIDVVRILECVSESIQRNGAPAELDQRFNPSRNRNKGRKIRHQSTRGRIFV